jgi:hypothetical protein
MKSELVNCSLAGLIGLVLGVVVTALYYRSVLNGAVKWAQKVYLDAANERDFYKSLVEESHES